MKIHKTKRLWLVLPKMPNGTTGLHSNIVANASVLGEHAVLVCKAHGLHSPFGLYNPVFHTSGSLWWGVGTCHMPDLSFLLCSFYHGYILILYKNMHEWVMHMYTVRILHAVVKKKSSVCVFWNVSTFCATNTVMYKRAVWMPFNVVFCTLESHGKVWFVISIHILNVLCLT